MERIFVFDSEAVLWKTCQELVVESVQWVAGTGHRPGVFLSGGGTFVPLYSSMGDIPADIFLTDERMVPVGSGPDTGSMIEREWRERLIGSEGTFYPVERKETAAQTATSYSATLRTWREAGGIFAVALLGVGSDGHTASLFPAQREHWERSSEWVIPTQPELEPMVERVSGTPTLFAQVTRHIVVLTGSQKIEVAKQWLGQRADIAAAAVKPAEERFVLLDRTAARDLDPSRYELR